MTMGELSSEHEPKLESLSLTGSTWVGPMGYLGYQLKELNVSGTNITDKELECITKVTCAAPPLVLQDNMVVMLTVQSKEGLMGWILAALSCDPKEPDSSEMQYFCACS